MEKRKTGILEDLDNLIEEMKSPQRQANKASVQNLNHPKQTWLPQGKTNQQQQLHLENAQPQFDDESFDTSAFLKNGIFGE